MSLPARRRTWESLGKINPSRSKPYLTELGPSGVHKAWIVAMAHLRLVDPAIPVPAPLRIVPDAKLVLDIGYLMIGIASDTFDFDEASESFTVKAGTCAHGVSPDAFGSFVQDFLLSGNGCRRLEKFCAGSSGMLDGFRGGGSKGLIYQGFLTGISKYLQVVKGVC